MAGQSEGGGKDDPKTHFVTREGTYKLMTLSEYSRPNRVTYNGQTKDTPVKVSFITLPDGPTKSPMPDVKICFNIGKELYVYQYKGVRKAADLTKPVDKRMYKGTQPTCHDFNQFTAATDSVMLLVGFSAGQVQLIDPIKRDNNKIYNEDRTIDKSKVTCIHWLPGSPNQFLVSHASGQMYVYNEELQCGPAPPHYQVFKHGDGFSIHTCKTKSTRNPLYRWVVGEGSINEFAFSPCCKFLSVVSQDGYMRVFNYDLMELVGSMKSFFGGLLCVSWSPDSRYVAVGGEDDLVSVWSMQEKRVVCRGQGHKSWVSVVAFDPYTTSYIDEENGIMDFSGSDEDFIHNPPGGGRAGNSLLQETLRSSTRSSSSHVSGKSDRRGSGSGAVSPNSIVSYRFGSVGQDTQLCLWDLTEEVLRQPFGRHRTSTIISHNALSLIGGYSSGGAANTSVANSTSSGKINHILHLLPQKDNSSAAGGAASDGAPPHHHHHHGLNSPQNHTPPPSSASSGASLSQKFATLALGDRKDKDREEVGGGGKRDHKRNFSLGSRGADKTPLLKGGQRGGTDEALRLLGTQACPHMDEVPSLEALVCKKITHERLTSLVFRDDCLVTACQDGFVYTWARPGKVGLTQQQSLPSPQQTPSSAGAVSTLL